MKIISYDNSYLNTPLHLFYDIHDPLPSQSVFRTVERTVWHWRGLIIGTQLLGIVGGKSFKWKFVLNDMIFRNEIMCESYHS